MLICEGWGGHPEFGEQPGEQGVGALVVDDEAGVDADRVGVGVPAEPVVRLEQRHVVRPART
jgi:hypothetical protein